MKAYSKYMALAAVAVSFAACQQEEMDVTSQDDLVRIEATIGNLPQTRVTHADDGATDFEESDAIYVVNTMRTGLGKEAATYTYDGTNWNTTDVLVWNGGTEKNNQFNAWYPASAKDGSFTIGSQTEGVEAFDLMTATTIYMKKTDDKKLPLNFNHLLTKVTVTVSKWGTETKKEFQFFEKAEFYTNTSITVSKEMNTTEYDGTYIFTANGSEPDWIEACLIGEEYYQESFTAIICPGDFATDTDGYWLKVQVGNGKTYNVKPGSISSLEPGKHYAFNLTVGGDVAEVSSVSVENWGADEYANIDAPDAGEKVEE